MRYIKNFFNGGAASSHAEKVLGLITFAFMLTLAGCGSHSRVIVAPDYKKRFAINAEVAVVPRGAPPEIIYRGDALKSLREANNEALTDPRQLILRYFYAQLVRDIEREVDVKSAFIAAPPHRYLVTKEVVKTTEEEVMVEIPDVNTRLVFDGEIREPALVLFLDDLRIGTDTDPYYADRAQHGLYTATPRRLVYAASFVLWDNRELKHICYGRVKSITPISKDEASLAEWGEVSRDFVRQIFEATGFLKRKDR